MSVSNMKRKREDSGDDSIESKIQKPYNEPVPTGMTNDQTIVKSIGLHDGMFLRLSYWLNKALTKSVNVGLINTLIHGNVYEPCVSLTNTGRKVLCVSHDEWNSMMAYADVVSYSVENKTKNTIPVLGEDCVIASYTVKPLFGKMYITLYRYDKDEMSSPFVLSEHEWKTMVKCIPNINAHLRQLVSEKDVNNMYIHQELTSSSTLERTDETQACYRLIEELKSFAGRV